MNVIVGVELIQRETLPTDGRARISEKYTYSRYYERSKFHREISEPNNFSYG